MSRTDDEILSLGAYTKDLLTGETFNELFKEYSDLSLANIVNSKPHEVKLREFEYAKLQALTGFLQHLASFAEAAENIINASAPEREPDED